MSYEPKPRLTLFINQHEGKPIKKQDGTFVTKANGEEILQGAFNGKINLPEGLPAGDYEVSVYRSVSKSGLEYLAGNIKAAYVKKDKVDQHSQAKGNGFQPQAEDSTDEIPF
jgi:hypothetical protein